MTAGSGGKVADIIRRVQDDYSADIYLYSAGIDHSGFGSIVRSYKREQRNALLILTTNGGLANSAYKIARFFQNQYEQFFICIPSVCKSAGTLLALGAHKLIMGQFSELGPLDVQLYERDEIFSRKSGLLSHSAFEALKHESFALYEHILLAIKARSGDNISFPVASTVASEMATGLMAPIFEQISPNVVGSDYRDLQVAIHYGQRLAHFSENIDLANVEWLTENYPSHDFIIDMQEASLHFKNVETPQQSLWELIGTISEFVLSESDEGTVLRISDLASEGEINDVEVEAEQSSSINGDGSAVDGRAGVDRRRPRKPRKERAATVEDSGSDSPQRADRDETPLN